MAWYLYIILPLTMLFLASKVPSKLQSPAAFIFGVLNFYFFMALVSLFGVSASIFFYLIGKKGLSQWATARAFKYTMRYGAGVEFVFTPASYEQQMAYLNSTRPAVFIGNHQTELDVLMLGSIFPKYCSVTAKSSLKKTPFLGWFMTLSGSVFIDRANKTTAREAMAGAAGEIKKRRQSVYMFPEGTRSYYKEPGLLPFKKGAFHLAVQAGVPIVPVVVANYSDVLYVQGWKYKPDQILVKVLKPIETKNLKPEDVDDLTRDIRDLMMREHISLTAAQRGIPVSQLEAQILQSNVTDAKNKSVKAAAAQL